MSTLDVGAEMPDSILLGADGPVKLRDRLGKPLVVYFYPEDETYGCTIQACGFRDRYADFQGAGADVIGISKDNADSHAKFRTHHHLPFELLSDPGGKVADQWGVRGRLGLGGRVTYVFDATGKLVYRFDSVIRFSKHIDEALRVIKSMRT